jgi:hypothetical protein
LGGVAHNNSDYLVGGAPRTHTAGKAAGLDPDVRKAFRSGRAVNDALRLVIELRKVGGSKQA